MRAPSPPRRPSRLTWPVLSRLLGRSLAGLALVWVVALVAWPENHRHIGWSRVNGVQLVVKEWWYVQLPRHLQHKLVLRSAETPWGEDGYEVLNRDSSLSVILGR